MKKKIIIIGGGFAGSHAAKHLDKHFDVTLIDTKDYFEFTPGILRSIVEPSHVRKIQVMHTHYLKWAKVIVGVVSEVGVDYVLVGKDRLKFDYLVVASGSSYNAPFKEQRVVTATRANTLRDYYEKLCEAKRVILVGGGLVGVELAGEICWKYGREKEITIIQSGDRLIARNSKKAIRYATDFLKDRGVNVLYNEKMVECDATHCITNKGKRLEADLIFLCTGIVPNYEFMKKNFSEYISERGFLKVNGHLQFDGLKNVFAIGDVAGVVEEKTAQNAERQAEIIVKNICSMDGMGDMVKYVSKRSPLIISLGKNYGILTKGDFVMKGVIPAMMKAGVEKLEMIKKRKVK